MTLPVRVPQLDYYLVYPQSGAIRDPRPEGILVEEFLLAHDHRALRLDSAAWAPEAGRWWSSATFSRHVRVDAQLRARVAGAGRDEAAIAYGQLGGGALPDEEELRTYFEEGEPLATSAPLWLGTAGAADGYHETRVYRLLFANELDANELDADGLAELRATWLMTAGDSHGEPRSRVAGTARRRIAADAFSWDLRRIGAGVAWCVDVTAHLATARDDAIRPLLRELMADVRRQGLIPVTIERFS